MVLDVVEHFLSWTTPKEHHLNTTTLIGGLQNMKLVKIRTPGYPCNGNEFVTNKFGYHDMVPHPLNQTLNITRADRIDIESGIAHWQKIEYRRGNKLRGHIPGKCHEYLDLIDKDPSMTVSKGRR